MSHTESASSFLNYKKAIINFIYSFSWDVTQANFDELAKSAKTENGKWHTTFLYNRPVTWADRQDQASYHPNIVSQNLGVLHHAGVLDNNVQIIVPITKDAEGNVLEKARQETISAQLNYSIRIYENGAGNCTFTFNLKDSNFKNIHSVIRLASTVSFNEEDHIIKEENPRHNTHSYLSGGEINTNNFLKNDEQIKLTELFDRILKDGILPPIWKTKDLWFDKKVVNNFIEKVESNTDKEGFDNWQTPYILTILEVERDCFERFEKHQHKENVKELGSFLAKFSTDNSTIATEYEKIKREYIFNSLGYYRCHADPDKPDGIRMKNYSHHSDLFYTIGKRSALALTPDLKGNPSYFVIPTLLNLVEILRSRWHLGSIVNLKLDETLQLIARSKELDTILNDVFLCRALYGFFLQNPAPYLFDGGAITEIAEAGEEIFWLKKLAVDTERKFDVLDKLLKDQLERKRLDSLMEYYRTKPFSRNDL